MEDVVSNFPQFNEMFEVYERHCIFERQNLQALNEAMNNADFKTYIKVSSLGASGVYCVWKCLGVYTYYIKVL